MIYKRQEVSPYQVLTNKFKSLKNKVWKTITSRSELKIFSFFSQGSYQFETRIYPLTLSYNNYLSYQQKALEKEKKVYL